MKTNVTTVWSHIWHPGPTPHFTPLPSTGRVGRNLPAAIATAVVLIAIVAAALVLSTTAFIAVVTVLCLGAVWELGGAFARVNVTVPMAPVYLGTIGMEVCAWTLGPEALMFALYVTIFVIIVWRLMDGRDSTAAKDVVFSAFTVLYVPLLASFVVLMLRAFEGMPGRIQLWSVVCFITVVCLNDIGGWAAGVAFGKHPMIPRISPHKSWEGFVGSVLACCASAVGFMLVFDAAWWWGIILGVLAAFIGTLGDLTESMIKREVGLKDMSNLLPGHGGILDRVDSILMTAPVFFVILSAAWGGEL